MSTVNILDRYCSELLRHKTEPKVKNKKLIPRFTVHHNTASSWWSICKGKVKTDSTLCSTVFQMVSIQQDSPHLSFPFSGALRSEPFWPGFRWSMWSQFLEEVICQGSGSQTDQHQTCWSPQSLGACCAASGVGYETLSPSSSGTTRRFSSELPSSAGCRPRGPGSGSTWPYVPPSAEWRIQVRLWLWC